VSVEFKGLPPEVYRAIIQIVDDRMKEIKVTREDFDRLREKVEETAAHHEERFDRLDRALAELAEAQKRTEQRVEELAEAQKETRQEVGRLDRALAELAEAQKETRQELRELAEAQRRTEQVVADLGVALRQTRREVGRLSDRFGFTLEDIARVVLPGYLERHLCVRVERLRRKHFTVNGAEYEVDLYGVGQRNGTKVTVLGEVKHRIYAREVKGFVRLLARVMPQVKTEVVKVMFGFLVHPSAEAVAKEAGIILVASYER
jgi:predicted RNase H-like nuclease (RuvC/YqgF family)